MSKVVKTIKNKLDRQKSSEMSPKKKTTGIRIITEPPSTGQGSTLPTVYSGATLKTQANKNFLHPEDVEEGRVRHRTKSIPSKSVEYDDQLIDGILKSKERRDSWQMQKTEMKKFLPSLSVICKYKTLHNIHNLFLKS